MDSKSSSCSHSEALGISHFHTEAWPAGTSEDHTCTAQCARIHLGVKLRTLEVELKKLATTLPVNDFIWYRSRIEDLFDQILMAGLK